MIHLFLTMKFHLLNFKISVEKNQKIRQEKKCNIELQLILMLINHPETKVIWYKNAFRNFSQKEKILYKQNKN